MPNITVLLADNNLDYLTPTAEFLRRKGYDVVEAETLADARSCLKAGSVDLAILDIRLENDKDENDVSGLTLAIDTAPRIPKIIVTTFPEYSSVRTALKSIGGNLPVTANFLAKEEGPEKLLDAVHKITRLRNVFIVHGHDGVARLEVEKFLRQVHLSPIILQQEVSGGLFLFEELEQASARAAFVIVLLTPDDQYIPKTKRGQPVSRARQNTIFELGYFIGKLGRARVCGLYKGGVELPSDIHDISWIPMDNEGGWKIAVAREMRIAAGIYLDLNDLV